MDRSTREPSGRLARFAAWRRGLAPETHALTRRLFLALLAVVYLSAFGSLWVQVHGLIGSGGIQPAEQLLAHFAAAGGARFWQLPTLFWLWPSDAGLDALCGAGVLGALLLLTGVAPRLVLALLWLLYLSLVTIGGIFLGYQWDALLLETGFLAIWLASPRLRPAAAARAPVEPLAVWLLRFLLFKLMFLSGAVKLLSGDEAWRDLSAMSFHYWTQPLPSAMSWWMAQLPAAFQEAEVLVTFAVELAIPWLIFAPRPWRWLAFPCLAGFQLLIAATGNYGFFNLLTLALCVLVLDDAALVWLVPARWRLPGLAPRGWPWRRIAFAGFAALLLSMSVLRMAERLGVAFVRPAPLLALLGATRQFASVNAYGLFAVMTKQRDEIALEGSADGKVWRAYRFRYKPGALEAAPRFAGLHMPRLDWQLWFASLRGCAASPWFHAFLFRVLEGEPAVLGLLADDPFPGAPPRFLRTPLAAYRFAPPGGDAWWRAEAKGEFCPEVTLSDGRLVRARP